nr:MAG TPA: hypothetical protein [Caudoviricetes sp.]
MGVGRPCFSFNVGQRGNHRSVGGVCIAGYLNFRQPFFIGSRQCGREN